MSMSLQQNTGLQLPQNLWLLMLPFLRPYNSHKIDFRSLPCIFLGYSSTHKGHLCFHQQSSRVYVSRHVIFNEAIFPYLPPTSNKPSSNIPPPSDITFHLLTQAASLSSTTPPSQPPPSLTPPSSSSTSTSSITHTPPLPSHPIHPNTSSYQTSTVSYRANHTQPSTSHYRPAPNNTHRMVTRSQTNSLKPRLFHPSLSDPSTVEPRLFSQAIKIPCWQQAMQTEYDALMRNNTRSIVSCPTNANVIGCKWIYRIK